MVVTPSNMVPLGTQAPAFSLFDVISERSVTLKDVSNGKKATALMFTCNHCPYVKYIQKEVVAFARTCLSQKVAFVAISANDVESYPDDSPEKMRELALELRFPFPYLYDETQEVARAYGAACTPDFFVFDSDLKLAYRGQFDRARPGNKEPITGEDLSHAIQCILGNKPIDKEQRPSTGCNIKWKESIS